MSEKIKYINAKLKSEGNISNMFPILNFLEVPKDVDNMWGT